MEWRVDKEGWTELVVGGIPFGGLRAGVNRVGQYFVAIYGGVTVTRNSLDDAMLFLEQQAKTTLDINSNP